MLPTNTYICKVLAINQDIGIVYLDIAEGDYKDYFIHKMPTTRKWSLTADIWEDIYVGEWVEIDYEGWIKVGWNVDNKKLQENELKSHMGRVAVSELILQLGGSTDRLNDEISNHIGIKWNKYIADLNTLRVVYKYLKGRLKEVESK